MAEYIARNEVLKYRETVTTDDYNGNEDLDVVTVEEILEITPADVVEREKVDKAIKEMENITLYAQYTRGDIRQKCIEILKRNIGESK